MRVRPAQVLSWQTWLAAWAPLASAALLLGVMVCLLPNVDGVAQLPRRNIALPSSLLHAYFGTCLALAVMNLTLWTWLKDKLYLHCAAFLGVGVLYVQLRVWPDDQVVGHTTAGQLLGTAYALHCVVATSFFSRLFEFRRNSVWSARFFVLVTWFNVIAMVLAMAGAYAPISRAVVLMALVSTSFGSLFVLYQLLVKRRWQYLPAALAYAPQVALGMLYMLRAQGLWPDWQAMNAPQLWFVTRVTEVLLLAWAVADRSRVAERALHVQRSEALSRALAAERDLEIKVRERTQALATSNVNLQHEVQVRTALQDQLEQTLANERELRAQQRQFFAMVNHEFRTPLAVIDSAASEQITFPSTDVQEQVASATQIRRACRRLATLVDNCLVSERLVDGALRLQLTRVSLRELVSEAAELVQWSRRHRLLLHMAPRPAVWACDATLLRIALSNLVDNALKYSDPCEIVVASAWDQDTQTLSLSVSDAGPRVPPDSASRLFERGQHGGHPASGFGLGLWAVQCIAQLHGGTLSLTPSPQGGNCFALHLPVLALQKSVGDEDEWQAGAASAVMSANSPQGQ